MEIVEAEQGVTSTFDGVSVNSQNFGEVKAHSNPAFEGLEGTIVPVSKGILEPTRHSAVRFEDNSHPTKFGKLNEGIPVARARKNGGRDLSARTNRVASTTLRGRGNQFKTSGSLRNSHPNSKEIRTDLSLPQKSSTDVITNSDVLVEVVEEESVSR